MKKRGDLPRLRIDSCQVRTLMKITAMACERKIVRIIGSTVLFRDDVLDMMSQFAVLLAQLAIFASLVSAAPYEVACCSVHLLLNVGIKLLTGFELENRDEVCRVDQRLIFGPLAVSQGALVSPLCELIDSLLHWRVN